MDPVQRCAASKHLSLVKTGKPGAPNLLLLNRAKKMSRGGKSNTPWKLASVGQTGERRANADAGSRVGFVGAGGSCCVAVFGYGMTA